MIKSWMFVSAGGSFVSATGGDVTTDGDYKIHTWLVLSYFCGSLLHFNGTDDSATFTDETGKTWTANGGAHIETTDKQFGSASGYFDGTGDYITTSTDSDFDLGEDLVSDFTLDFWFNSEATLASSIFYSDRYEAPSSGRGWACWLNRTTDDGKICWWSGIGDSVNYLDLYTTTGGYNDGDWHHVACVRQGTTYKIYVDGLEEASTTYSYSPYPGQNPCIGRDLTYGSSGELDYAGYIDEFRISKNIARWTEEFDDDLPDAEYSIDTYKFVVSVGGDVKVLVVAGGGGGSFGAGSGGGMVQEDAYTVTAKAYSVMVGDGGTPSTYNGENGYKGGNSVFDTLVAEGGGAGNHGEAGGDGGCGGGGGYNGAGGTGSQGYDGHAGYGPYMGGGGGGMGSAAPSTTGGDGLEADIDGVTYCKGGNSNSAVVNGAANTGDGGSGCVSGGDGIGGAGGSGKVIIRYQYQ